MSDREPNDLVGRVHRFFGMKPSAEEIEKTAPITEAIVQIEALGKQMGPAMDREQRELQARLDQELAGTRAWVDQIQEQASHEPREIDQVDDMEAIMSAAKRREGVVEARNRTSIYKWDDGYGNIVYLNPTFDSDQVQPISARITEQHTAFSQLTPAEQYRTKQGFEAGINVEQPYHYHLRNEALRVRFEELKANS